MSNRTRQTCANCAHNGQCADLHYCGGAYWQPEDGEERDDGDPWDGYDERDAMDERAWAYQRQMDEKW